MNKRNPPVKRSIHRPNRKRCRRSFPEKLNERAKNHNNVIATIKKPQVASMIKGVSFSITIVNKLRKNTMAFGFRTFVKNPLRKALDAEILA